MSYEPTNWQTGDVVTSAKLNKLEQGVANAGGGGEPVVIHFSSGEGNVMTADKTYAEVAEIFTSGAEIWLDLSGWDDTNLGEHLVLKKLIYPNDGSPVYEMSTLYVGTVISLQWIVFLSDGSIQSGYSPN